MTRYLTAIEVMLVHRVMIERFGGADGVRDMGALESALFRSQSGYYADAVAEAAALFESLAINHPFVDGNKRVAFGAVDVFLRINAIRLVAKPMAIHKWMIGHLEKASFALASIETYLRKYTRRA